MEEDSGSWAQTNLSVMERGKAQGPTQNQMETGSKGLMPNSGQRGLSKK